MSCERKWSQYNKIQCHTRWWFQTFFIFFTPIWGDSHFDEYFSDGLKPQFWKPACLVMAHLTPVFSRGILASWLCSGVHGHCAAGGRTRCGFWMVRFWEGLVNPSLETGLGLDINCDFTNFYCMYLWLLNGVREACSCWCNHIRQDCIKNGWWRVRTYTVIKWSRLLRNMCIVGPWPRFDPFVFFVGDVFSD